VKTFRTYEKEKKNFFNVVYNINNIIFCFLVGGGFFLVREEGGGGGGGWRCYN